MNRDLLIIRSIADYQFGQRAGAILFPENAVIIYSKNTGRFRHIYFNDTLIANFRANDGMLTLSIHGARLLMKKIPDFEYSVVVLDEISEFPSKGRNIFAKHVIHAGEKIRPGDEVIIVNSKKEVLAVGRSMMNSIEMATFKKGVAVKVRHGRGN
jgi:predicted RNA-binding protein (TIGR00451 family)